MTESALRQRHIILGVTGGIAAYKSADLVRRLREAGAEVRVVMTRAATEFVTPLTFQAVSGQPVHTSLLDPEAEAAMGHIALARWADAVLVAPASADVLARLAHGQANDLLTTLCLATEAPLAVAPAMNRVMWLHPAVRDNVSLLERRGVAVFGPAVGDQACGEQGAGRMLEPLELVRHVGGLFGPRPLQGRRVVVTAGPTREALDPVRFISNRSSGRMGFALAAAARDAGADVELVSGPVALETPPGVRRTDVETAGEMHDAVQALLDGCDLFIGCAAVADYRPAQVASGKIKKREQQMQVELERNPDILASVAAASPRPFTVGFAAETEDLQGHAEDKRRRKGLDLIAGNLVGQPDSGFDVDSNRLWLRWQDGDCWLGPASKAQVADELIAFVADRMSKE
ncbi:bifunctional phosphopantothenoylcysteine decarboxylase/phosphopantothenate--cysteine ligase CoaBC [Methylonatrum kenyense]|uniref:bifunctional phosphopantothenoylcysteine decarboxylase/phosphopantothenate--cysteine ligase CoaBC n=1 Tax=Methylonatrum kenyense TaxID=455253 RepID=UPI0020BEF098|nr:bifunctional phosphopantothenoylcysteine decarboxylase/phosphopantothenate--cysteine ligase CoaBC [Methylonatrum kenyense]MCK8515501.1 bifunctional phosphopantothenoylcysteine decarboxylase/phosphopantothenate--cysteine ligase CoaBC [Methylonatrum kenyense]